MSGIDASLARSVPALDFAIESSEAVRYAAAPTIAFRLAVDSDTEIRSLMLSAQIRIAAPERAYDEATKARLIDLFGAPESWGRTLRSLLWTHTTLLVPAFSGTTTVDLPVSCTYDFEVAAAKYLYAVEHGEIPLEFLFSGTVFFGGEGGALRTARISWESEAAFRMPVAVWRDAVENHFPGSAWLRVRRDVFDRLVAYRTSHALPTWEAVIDDLLKGRT
ncbi:MAG TPA: DUF6084 family protein [Gaiellaceae bacterium]|nr:DUF6084 family protein [Gaiellaceae bacterium]